MSELVSIIRVISEIIGHGAAMRTLPTSGHAGRKGSRIVPPSWQRSAQGYTGAASTVRQYVRAWRSGPRHTGRRRHGEDAAGAPPPTPLRFSPRQTRWILLRPVEELTETERPYRHALCQACPPIALAHALADDFGRMVRARAAVDLNDWLLAVRHSRIPELVSFAGGIVRDFAAVSAALTLPHSQGQVEGQVNRLKLLKRQSYGRASLDLLRCRILYDLT